MIYEKFENEIKIYGKADFNPQHILDCGQIFCYKKIDDFYRVWSKGKVADIFEEADGYKITTCDVDYFINFFDLETDYSLIKEHLNKFEIMKEPIRFGSGIRLLKNDVFEILVSFIISANNNIKRIQNTIFALKKKFNSEKFPSHSQLLSLSVDDFVNLGLGYRAPQLYKALRQFCEEDLKRWRDLSTEQIRTNLINLSGVGPKVADCVLLFGFWRKDVFPVDTWINKMYNMFYSQSDNRIEIRNQLLNIFGDYSGYAQQYLFYYQRSFVKK